VSGKLSLPEDGLKDFLKANWQFPKVFRAKLLNMWRIVDKEGMPLKATASELLGFYVLLRYYVNVVIVPMAALQAVDIEAELAPFYAACKVVDKIMALKRGHADAPHREELLGDLQSAMAECISLHVARYGTREIKPKHHRMQHIADQIRKDLYVLDCWIIERLHLIIREILGNVRNPVEFEASVLRGVCLKQMMTLKDTVLAGLIGPTAPLQGFPFATIANRMRFCGMYISIGDVVTRNGIPARVTACAVEDDYFVLVEVWLATGVAQRWRPTDDVQAWKVEELELAAAWYADGDDVVVLEMV